MIITVTDFIFQGKCCYIIHKNQCIKMSCHWWKHIINSVMPLWDLLKWDFSVTPDSYFSSFPPKNMRFQTAGMAWPEAQLWPVSRRSERWTMTNVEEKNPQNQWTSNTTTCMHTHSSSGMMPSYSPLHSYTHYCKLIHTSHTNLTECLSSPSFLPWRLIPPSGWTFPEDPGLRGGGWIRGWRLVGWVSVCTCFCVHVCK